MAILKIELTEDDVLDVLEYTYKRTFELTSYANNTTLKLVIGRAEEIGGYLYKTTDEEDITDSASDGIAYVYLDEVGDGTGTAELLSDAPSYDGNKGGYYFGDKKALFWLVKSGATYYNKTKISTSFLKSDINLQIPYTPSITISGGGSLSGGTIAGKYQIVGNLCYYNIIFTNYTSSSFTSNSYIALTLPTEFPPTGVLNCLSNGVTGGASDSALKTTKPTFLSETNNRVYFHIGALNTSGLYIHISGVYLIS
jgi:hypothetical protein